MPQHSIKPGEHLAFIAAEAGFRDVDTVWEDGGNAELREKREHPGVLAPGDTLFVPVREEKQLDRSTGAHHVFKVKGDKLWLRLVLRDFDQEPIADTEATLEVEGQSFKIVIGGDGRIDQEVPRNARKGILRVPDLGIELTLDIGMLDPVDIEAGWRARLVNLGYFHGDPDAVDAGNERMEWALQEFQCDHDLKVTSQPDGATLAKLLELCGS